MKDQPIPVRCCCTAGLLGYLPAVVENCYHLTLPLRADLSIPPDAARVDFETIEVSLGNFHAGGEAVRLGFPRAQAAWKAEGLDLATLKRCRLFIPAEPWEIALDDYLRASSAKRRAMRAGVEHVGTAIIKGPSQWRPEGI